MADKTHYDVLGVSSSASTADIQKAYHQLARDHHPDRMRGATEKARAEQVFTAVTNAFNVLSDAAKRSQYDTDLKDNVSPEEKRKREAKSCDRAGVVKLNDGQVDDALRMFRAAVHLDPEPATYHAHLALALEKSGALGDASREWDQVVKREGFNAKYMKNAGQCAEKAGMKTKARRLFESAYKLDKDDPVVAEAVRRLSGNDKKTGLLGSLSGLFKRT